MTGTTSTAASSSAELRAGGDGNYGYDGGNAWEREGKGALAHREGTRGPGESLGAADRRHCRRPKNGEALDPRAVGA
jgi:hypothetical protein